MPVVNANLLTGNIAKSIQSISAVQNAAKEAAKQAFLAKEEEGKPTSEEKKA